MAEEDNKGVTASRMRLSEQSALMLNIDTLITDVPKKDSSNRLQKSYKNFAVFRGTKDTTLASLGGGGHIDLTRFIFRNRHTRYLLKEIPNEVLSSLQPCVKLYKVFMPVEKSASYCWRIPFDDIDGYYPNISSPYQKPILETDKGDTQIDAVQEVLKGAGKLHGIGIKSFSYKYVGTNPAEVNTNIEADLTLYFQDVRDLVREIPVTEKDSNWEGLRPEKIGPKIFSYTDLVADVGRNEVDKKTGQSSYNSDYYRIKAVVGYMTPGDKYLRNLVGDAKFQKVKDAIQTVKVILYLNPHNHDITFEENGSISITIKYIAAMASVLSEIDALAITPEHERMHELSRKLKAEKEEKKHKIDRVKNNCDEKRTDKEISEQTEKIQSEDKKELLALETQLDNQRNKVYSEIFKRLIGDPDGGNQGKIYTASFSKYALGVLPTPLMGDGPSEAEKANAKFADLSQARTVHGYAISSLTEEDKEQLALAGEHKDVKVPEKGILKKEPDPDAKSQAKDSITSTQQENQRTDFNESSEPDRYDIKFVFLGDVFDVFCESLKKQTPNTTERPRLLLTEFNMEIPIPTEGIKSAEEFNAKGSYKQICLNIADIPISLEMLNHYMIEKVVRPRRDNYPLLSLLYDIMTEVVGPAISPTVFGKKSVLNKQLRLSSLTVALPLLRGGADILTNEVYNNDKLFSGIIVEQQGASAIRERFENANSRPDSAPFANYVLFYCSNQLPNLIKANNGDFLKDEEAGIYHYFIGSDSSLLKKISFSRTNTPFYKEAKAQSSGGAKSLGRMREVYDVSMTMFGNNVYRPGDYIFIEPLFFRGKAAVDLEQKIGLGGYYQIIDVGTKMSDQNFETTLSAVLYGHIEQVGGKKQVIADDNTRSKC